MAGSVGGRWRRAAAAAGAALWLGAAAPCGTAVIPDGIGQSDPSAVTSLNPLVSQSLYNLQARLLLYRPVVWVGQQDTMDADRSLAQSIAVSDDTRSYTVTLKPWLWSDGKPVRADDVLFCWELIRKLGPIFAYNGQGGVPDRIASVTVLDAHRFVITLMQPANPVWFELNGISQFFALPRHAWGDLSRDELWRRQTDPALFAVVDGPFKLEDYRLDRYISYVPNPLYGGHRSTLRRLVVDFLEGSSALHALQAGEVDMAHVPFALWDQMKGTTKYRIVRLAQSFGYRSFIPNLKNARDVFFHDVRVRQALADATNQQEIIDLIYHGFSVKSHSPIPPVPPTYLSPAARAGQMPVGYDPGKARALLDQAGWQAGPDGVRAKAGRRLEFTVTVSVEAPDRIEELQIVQQEFRAVGVSMHIQPVTFNQLLSTMYGPPGGWDVVLLSWSLTGFPDGTTFFDTGGSNNVGGYSDPKMDALIHDSVGKAGLAALWAYQDYAAEQQPWNFLPEGAYPLLVSPDIEGVAEFTSALGYWSPEYLSVSKARCDASHDFHPA